MTARKTLVVTFRADEAEEHIAAFRRWMGAPVKTISDLGVLDGLRRYKVPEGLWKVYVHEKGPHHDG